MKNFEQPENKPKKDVLLNRRTFLGLIGGSLIAATLNSACSEKPKKQKLPTPDSDFEPKQIKPLTPHIIEVHEPGKIVFPKILVEDVKKSYSERAIRYGMRIIENGQRIAMSKDKEQQIQKLRKIVEEKYSSRIKIPKFFGFVDEPKELKQIAAVFDYRTDIVQRAKDRGREVTLPIGFIIAAASNEGHLFRVTSAETEITQWDQQVDGFIGFGLDCFGDDYEDIKLAGLLPPNFDKHFKKQQVVNEKGGIVTSANFSSKGAALNAFVAELAFRQMICKRHLRQQNIDLTTLQKNEYEEVIMFLTYIYYNAGPTIGRKIVQGFKTADDALAHYNLTQTNPEKIDLTSAPANAYVVMAAMHFMKLAGATDGLPEKESYWWLQEKKPVVTVE